MYWRSGVCPGRTVQFLGPEVIVGMAAYRYGSGPSAPPYQGQQGWSQGYGQPYSQPYGQPSTAGAYGNPQSQSGYGGYSPYGQELQPSYNEQQVYPPSYGSPYRHQAGVFFPPGTEPEIIQAFQQADTDGNGTIDANELGRLLLQYVNRFSPRTLRLMLHLYADGRDTTRIGPAGFAKLWREIKVWTAKFNQFDMDRSRTIEVEELRLALLSFNFAIPDAVLQMLVSKYDMTGSSRSIQFDNFLECGFIVKGLTEKFRDKDQLRVGSATFDYTSFMLMVIPFIAA